jgi:phosphoribosylanthranilate isomerase
MSRVLVKICGITCLEDALVAVEAGADALGFNFYRMSPRFTTIEKVANIVEQMPQNTLKVGVFVDAGADEMATTVREAGLDLAQVHGDASGLAVRFWQALSAGPDLKERMSSGKAEAFLVDTPAGAQRGGTGRSFDWSLVRGLPGKLVLAGGLGPDNVAEAIRQVRPWGIDACSRLESAPGRKNAAKVRALILAVREAEAGA